MFMCIVYLNNHIIFAATLQGGEMKKRLSILQKLLYNVKNRWHL